MVRKWLNLDDESSNPLAQQYLIPVGKGEHLRSTVMQNLFHQQNKFLRNTKMQLVHNLNDMDEVLTMHLKEHVDIAP
jgi:hypothetical protein